MHATVDWLYIFLCNSQHAAFYSGEFGKATIPEARKCVTGPKRQHEISKVTVFQRSSTMYLWPFHTGYRWEWGRWYSWVPNRELWCQLLSFSSLGEIIETFRHSSLLYYKHFKLRKHIYEKWALSSTDYWTSKKYNLVSLYSVLPFHQWLASSSRN